MLPIALALACGATGNHRPPEGATDGGTAGLRAGDGGVVDGGAFDGWLADAGMPDAGEVPDGGPSGGRTARVNPIPEENAKPGSLDWVITQNTPGHDIEGYSPSPSVLPGDEVPFAITVQPVSATFTWRAYRLGYYGGRGAREVARGVEPLSVSPQPPCPVTASTGLVSCHWATNLQVPTEASWVPGLYLLRVTKNDGFQRYVPFFIRDDATYPETLVGVATGTWAAYNAWGGESLYTDSGGYSKGIGHAFQVSFDKPYEQDSGAGQLLEYEMSLAKWLEAQGLDVAYARTEDMDRDVTLLQGPKVFIMPGHDEYWTHAERRNVEDAVAGGMSLLNFGANSAYWQIRLESSSDARDRRVITGYKDASAQDPVGPLSPELTCKFRSLATPMPENALLGVMFDARWNQWGMPAVVGPTSHWAFDQTGLQPGDTLWQVAGYEVDQLVDNGFQPANVEVLVDSPMLPLSGDLGRGHMVIRRQGEAWVFSAGGVNFTRALASNDMADPRLQRLAANVLYRALGRPVPADLPTFTTSASVPVFSPSATVRVMGGVRGSPGDVDGPFGTGKFLGPTSLTSMPAGGLAVVDIVKRKVRIIDAAGAIKTLASGFDLPFGVASDAKGNVYVSDSNAGVLKQVTPSGVVSVLAGQYYVSGSLDGPGLSATFASPAGMVLGPKGLLVTDVYAGTLRLVDLTRPGHTVTTLASGMYRPSGVAVAPDGTAYVVETGNARILAVHLDKTVTVIAGGAAGFKDGPTAQAQLMPFLGIARLKDGSLVVSDPGNYRLRRVPTDGGNVTTFAGTGRGGQALGSTVTTDVALPTGLAVGPTGTLYVSEAGNADILAIGR